MFRSLRNSILFIALLPAWAFAQDSSLTVIGDGVYEVKGDRGVFGYIVAAADKDVVMFQPCTGQPRRIEKSKLRKTDARCGEDAPWDLNPLKVSCAAQQDTWARSKTEILALPVNQLTIGKVWEAGPSGSYGFARTWSDIAATSNSVGIAYCGNDTVVIADDGKALMKIIDAQIK